MSLRIYQEYTLYPTKIKCRNLLLRSKQFMRESEFESKIEIKQRCGPEQFVCVLYVEYILTHPLLHGQFLYQIASEMSLFIPLQKFFYVHISLAKFILHMNGICLMRQNGISGTGFPLIHTTYRCFILFDGFKHVLHFKNDFRLSAITRQIVYVMIITLATPFTTNKN